MPRPNYTDVTILLDRSGSMDVIRDAVIEGVNGYVASQNQPGKATTWTLMQFDSPGNHLMYGEGFPHVVYQARHQGDVPPLTRADFVPRGQTAYYHAACKAVEMTGRRLAEMPEHERPSMVLFVVMTDGMDNKPDFAHSLAALREKIRHQREKYNWQFIFLGANLDAKEEAAATGMDSAYAFRYDHTAVGYAQAMNFAQCNTKALREFNNA